MRLILPFVLMLAVSASAMAAYPDGDPRLIVPGQRIGPARLGMTRPLIDEINRTAECPVGATYDASGHSIRLETHWGGGCLISDKIQVGLPFESAGDAFGRPDRILQSARYQHAIAVWIVYETRGVAFRVLRWPSGALLIQSIAVFAPLLAQSAALERMSTPLPGRMMRSDAVRLSTIIRNR